MSLRGASLLVLLLVAACAHSPARTDNAGPPVDAGASATPPAIAQPAAPPAQPPPTAPVQAEEPVATKPVSAESRVDFALDVQPILASRCQPCHFPGGKMYDRLPFDRATTIRTLGTKLFTRIKAEDEQTLIRRFLAQPD